MPLERLQELQTGMTSAVEGLLSKRGNQFDTPFAIETNEVPQLVIALYNALTQAVLTWNGGEKHPIDRFSYLDAGRIPNKGDRFLQQNLAIQSRLAGSFGFKRGAVYSNQLCIRPYFPEGKRAHMDLGGVSLDLTKSTPVRGRDPLLASTGHWLALRTPQVGSLGGQTVWSIKLIRKPGTDRSGADKRRANTSNRESIEIAKALEAEGLEHPYRGGAPEMGNLLKTVKRF